MSATNASPLTIPDDANEATVTAWEAARDAWQSLPFGAVTSDNLPQVISSFIAKAAEDAVRAAAPLVVAAELDRLAEVLDQRAAAREAVDDDSEPCEDECEEVSCHTVAAVATYSRSGGILRRRAAELRGGAR